MCFAQSPNICIKKKVLVVYVVFFVCFEVFPSFLKSFVYFFSLRTAYLASFVYTLYIEKKIYHSFLFVNTDISQATFPASFVHRSTWFSNFAAFFLLFWFHVKSHEHYEVTYATLLSLCIAVSDLRRPCREWLESSERRMRCFQKKCTSSKGNPFSIFFLNSDNQEQKLWD